jgi:high affinity Mn2+ porin
LAAHVGYSRGHADQLYYNPELLQGFGLHHTTGAAGFPNGEAQKSNFPYFSPKLPLLKLQKSLI